MIPSVQVTSATPSRGKQSLIKNKLVTEEELRAYARCSEFSYRGGRVELPIKTAIIEFAYIRLVLNMLRNQTFDYRFELNQVLRSAYKHLGVANVSPEEIQELIRTAAIGVDELFKTIPPNLYIPIFGAFEFPVKVSKSTTMLRVSSILTTKRSLNQGAPANDPDYRARTLHAVTFSPYHVVRDMEADIVQQVKALTLGSANPVRMGNDKPRVRLHIFSAKQNPAEVGLHYTYIEHRTPIDFTAWGKYLEQPIKQLESQYHYPLTPCPYACPFRATCQPDPFITRGL
jgi:hypothetical protein